MVGFTLVEEVERISMGPRETAEKVVRDFYREGWVGDHCIKICRGGGSGGGGGYSGGSSGDARYNSCGGGGGSYNDGNNQDNACCYRTAGHGQVTITLL